jgi:hypothetical protein
MNRETHAGSTGVTPTEQANLPPCAPAGVRPSTADSPGIQGRLPGALPTSAGPCNLSQACCKRPKGSLSGLGVLWKTGQRRLVLGGGQRIARPALCEGFPLA